MSTEKLQQKKLVKVGFFGGTGSGKTQLANMLNGKGFLEPMPPTQGMSFSEAKPSPGAENLQLKLHDFSGQTIMTYPTFLDTYAKAYSEISVICINQNDPDSLEAAEAYAKKIQSVVGPDAPIVIAITKTDQKCNIKDEDIVQFKEKFNITSETIKTSAKDGTQIDALQKCLTNLAKKKVSNEEVAEKINYLKSMVSETLKVLNEQSNNKFFTVPQESEPYQALSKLQRDLNQAKTEMNYVDAVKAFRQAVTEDVLIVQPPNVRGPLQRLLDCITNLDFKFKYFADNESEIKEKQRFTQQMKLKDELASFKEEEEPLDSGIRQSKQ